MAGFDLSKVSQTFPGTGTYVDRQAMWTWQTAVITAPFGQGGRAGVDQDQPSQATILWLHKMNAGVGPIDWSAWISRLTKNDAIYLQTASDADSWHRYNVTGKTTLNAETWMIPVTTDAGSPEGSEPGNGANVVVIMRSRSPEIKRT